MIATAYLIQALLIAGWWLGMLVDEDFYRAFQFSGIGPTAFNSFFLPDVVVLVCLSIARAYKESRALEYLILGSFAYAALFCVNAAIASNSGYLPTSVMALGLAYNVFIVRSTAFFRTSKSNSTTRNGLKTVLQIITVWLVTLVLFPYVILVGTGQDVAIQRSLRLLVGVAVFAASSLLGLASAFVMVRDGEGTPLPLDQTNRLVTSGVYGHLRNPMAVAGVGQSFAYQSVPLLLYTIIGAVLWNWVVRPLEEQDMLSRFGQEYSRYRDKVRCWIPSFKR